MAELSALVVHGQSSVAAVILRVLDAAGIGRTVVVPTCSLGAALEATAFDLVLVNVHDRAREPEVFARLAGRQRAEGAIIGTMTTSVERSARLLENDPFTDFVVLKPFTPDELRLKVGPRLAWPPRMPRATRETAEGGCAARERVYL